MTTSYSIDPFHLVQVPVPRDSAAAKPAPQPTNHIVVIDCSGSMSGDLPHIRRQIKEKLPKQMSEGDTLSVIWFSGRGEFGVLLKKEPLATLKDLAEVNKAIDRWLKPVGLTGFKEPLEEAGKLVDEIGGVCSLFFMSDGYDNQWDKSQILKAVQVMAPKCASTTFVEYGYYCNHPLLVSMAEEAGGTLIFSEDYPRYEPLFEASMKKQSLGGKRVEVSIKGDAIKGFAFALVDGNLMTFKVEGDRIQVPEHLDEIWFLSPSAVGTQDKSAKLPAAALGAAYAAVALYSQRVSSDIVFPLLKTLGDVRLIKQFSGCFGKQKYAEFTDIATGASFDATQRLVEGYDPTAVPDDNAFTILDLLRILGGDDDNRLLLDSPDFKYNRIGRSRVQESTLSEEDQTLIDELEDQKIGASAKDVKTLQKKIDAIMAAAKPLTFVADPSPNGVPIDNLVFNETRPNVSVQTRREGKVNLKDRKPKTFKKVPDEFPTHIYRNYTIIRDGLINVERLPLRLTGGTVRKLREAGLPEEALQASEGEDRTEMLGRIRKASKEREVNLVIDLRVLPVLNRSMVKEVSARTLFEKQYELTKARATQKVLNSVKTENFPSTVSEGYTALYGEEAAEWLKEQGFNDRNGFSPKVKAAEKKDVYIGKELKVSLKGLSSLPSLNEFKQRAAAKKAPLAGHKVMQPAVEAVNNLLESDVYKKAKDQKSILKGWLDSELTDAKKSVRKLLYEVSQIRFGVVVGQTWFSEFSSLDENGLNLTFDEMPIQCTVDMKEIEVPI